MTRKTERILPPVWPSVWLLGFAGFWILASAQSTLAQSVSRTPGEKTFITDIVGIDGFFQDLISPPPIPELDQYRGLVERWLDLEDPNRPRFDNGTREIDPAELEEAQRTEGGQTPEPGLVELDVVPFRVIIIDPNEETEAAEGERPEDPYTRGNRKFVSQRLALLQKRFTEARSIYLAEGVGNAEHLRALEDLHLAISELVRQAETLDFSSGLAIATWNVDATTAILAGNALSVGSLPFPDTRRDLSAIRQRVSQKDLAAPSEPAAPHIWGDITYGNTKNTSAAAREGHSTGIASGVVFRSRPDLIWGVSVNLSTGENTSAPPLNTVLDSRTLGLGAFVTYTLPQDVDLTFAGNYRKGDHDISINGFTGSYDTHAFSGSAQLSKVFTTQEGWSVTPSLTATYASLTRDTYVNSASRTITGGTQNFGLLKPSVRVEKIFLNGQTAYAPWLEVNADWLFDKPARATLSDGLVLGRAQVGSGLAGGVEIAAGSATRFNLGGSYRTRGDDKVWSINAGFRTEF